MIYQSAKEIGAMAAIMQGRVDALLLTGGMSQSDRLASALGGYVSWIAPNRRYTGEDELRALAEGTLRVLRNEEQPRSLVATIEANCG